MTSVHSAAQNCLTCQGGALAGSGVSPRIGSWNASEHEVLSKREGRRAFGLILSKRLGPPRNETLRKRLGRLRKILKIGLHRRVEIRLCKLEFDDLKRVTNFVESITECVVFSTPDAEYGSAHLNRLLRWAYSVSVYSTDHGVRQWKLFGSLLKWHAFQSETEKPEIPSDLPGFGNQRTEDFPSFWFKLCPWMESIFAHGAKSKLDLTRVAHLASSRGLPPADAQTRTRSLQKHRETLSSRPDTTGERVEILRNLSRLVGRKLKREFDYYSNAHLSLTTSSSLDTSVREGGRAKEISEKFRKWQEYIPQKTTEGVTLLGRESTEMCGFPRWMTVGRKDCFEFIKALPHDDEGAIHRDVLAGESRQDTSFDFENFKYEDPIYALDEATGYQLHQWAVEELLELGIFTGDKHDPSSIQKSSDTFPLIRRTTIGEPGAKSRVVTVAEACLTIFLQPFSHHTTGWLRNHPSAGAGLTRAAQGFEYAKALHLKEHPEKEKTDLKMLSSDLSTATDYCIHSYSQAMLEGFEDGLEETSNYSSLSIELLCSPRVVLHDGEPWTTHRGILMGDPGAKTVLTLHNLCAELEALIRYRSNTDISDSELLRKIAKMRGIPSQWWRCFACSGDDHVAVGPDSYLREITRSHSRNGMCVSWPQNFISRVGGTYCEEMFFIRGYTSKGLFKKQPLFRLGYAKHVHVDSIKLRLLSPCSKEHEGKDEPNPGIGKAQQISKVLAWLETPVDQLKGWASWRFCERFSALLPGDASRFLPVALGGVEAPSWHLTQEEVLEGLANLPASHLSLIEKLLKGNTTHMERRVLSSFASNTRARGVDADLIKDQVRELLGNIELTKAINVDEIQSVIDVEPDEFRNWNARKKFHVAQQHGFLSINDAINLIERPYIFRDLLFPDMSEKHGYKPSFSPAYSSTSWNKRKRKFNTMLDDLVPIEETMSLSLDSALSISNAVTGGDLLEVPPSNLLIPKDVVETETRPQLRTPY